MSTQTEHNNPSSSSEMLHFSIEGEFITNHFRQIAAQGQWSKALSQLLESLIGFKEEHAIMILSGSHKLVGVNELLMEEDNDSADYVQDLMDQYSQLFYYQNTWFQFDLMINTIKEGEDDIYDRGHIYSPTHDEGAFINGNYYTLKEVESNNPPSWLVAELMKNPALENNIKNVIEVGVMPDQVHTYNNEKDMLKSIVDMHVEGGLLCRSSEVYEFMQEDFVMTELYARRRIRSEVFNAKYEAKVIDYRTKITEQAINGAGFIIIVGEHGTSFSVPKAPFIQWSLKRNGSIPEDILRDYPWESISDSGMKMQGDDPIHSDLVIGAGYDPEDFYRSLDKTAAEFKDATYKALFSRETLSFAVNTSHEDMIVYTGSGSIEGFCHFTDDNDDNSIDNVRGKILVIPDSSVDYFEMAKVASLVIAIKGGPLSHLALNAAESDIKFVLLNSAVSLSPYVKYTFDLDSKTVAF